MTIEESKNLVAKTFEQSFDESKFLYFIKNLLNGLDESKTQVWAGNYIPESYRSAIKSYKRIGQYTDKKNNVIDVLTVNVKRDNTLERARTLQRNFIARHLKQRNHEAALVAFYTEEYEDWRFSLVIMELNLTKTRVEIELSPAKRYSFLVGKNERSHTAQNQFVNLLIDKNDKHSLDDIEQAFNIETVTKEFFLEYRDLFIRTKTSLDKILKSDSKVKEEFENKSIDSVNFSKKLLGQIVFLYFLQKKGWFGVGRNEKWGEGSKKFLRELFESKHGKYNNFYNDILEPLFYEALRIDRSHDDHYYSRFDCKIPFLNGGLFDPIGDYNWVQTDITLPNELFSNTKKTAAGDVGDGTLDIFDRYNFTVIEDEPLEKEVAIDPELLGKAYEKFNAIRPDNFDEYLKVLKSGKKGEETKFNKQYGVYYTPREIVHYMCRESLINYLASEFSDRSDAYQKIDLEQLDAFGNTTRKGQLPLEAEYKSVPHIPKSDIETLINYGEIFGENEAVVELKGKETDTYYYKLPESVRKNALLIDEKLANVLICDPAVGSGAFPVGMMHEIVSTRNLLTIFIKENSRNKYHFKRECIEKSLYGVDIDPGAVEIAKLRLWLSLVVDEDDINNIKPLPNLDYKIVRGNSLIGFPDDWKSEITEKIEKIKKQYFIETRPQIKKELKREIDEQIKKRLLGSEINFGYPIDFDFKTFFSEVFHYRNGFDIIIANPPYVRQEKIKDIKYILEMLYECYVGTSDLYTYFYERGLKLLKHKGTLIFISPSKFFRSDYGEKIRRYIKSSSRLMTVIDFGELPIFESNTFPTIILTSKQENRDSKITICKINEIFNFSELTNHIQQNKFYMDQSELEDMGWVFENDSVRELRKKIKNQPQKLKDIIDKGILLGIKTGLNKAFVINNESYKNLIQIDKKSEEILVPYLKGDDIRKYRWSFSNEYLILSKKGIKIQSYKAVFDHLSKYKSELEKRSDIKNNGKWYELRSCSYYNEFEKDKIAFPEIGMEPRFALIPKGVYFRNSAHLIPSDDLCLLSLLNSKVSFFFFKLECDVFGEVGEGGRIMFREIYVERFPLPLIQNSTKEKLSSLSNKIVNAHQTSPQANTKQLEDQIDIMVYKIYDLTYEEVKIIDSNIGDIISEEKYEKFEIA